MDKFTRNFGGILLAALVFCGCTAGRSRFANPFIGTDYTGHTSPAASCPLGMVQPGPHTGNYLWKYCSGYNHADSLILGFTQNRLSGTGVPSLCNVLIMPFSGNAGPGFASAKAGEKAVPGYYEVDLPDNGAHVEITCSPRVACYTMAFDTPERKLFVNLQNIQIRFESQSAASVRDDDRAPGSDLGNGVFYDKFVSLPDSFKVVRVSECQRKDSEVAQVRLVDSLDGQGQNRLDAQVHGTDGRMLA